MDETYIVDVSSEGPYFTWSDKRQEGHLAKKLEYLQMHNGWMDLHTSLLNSPCLIF